MGITVKKWICGRLSVGLRFSLDRKLDIFRFNYLCKYYIVRRRWCTTTTHRPTRRKRIDCEF